MHDNTNAFNCVCVCVCNYSLQESKPSKLPLEALDFEVMEMLESLPNENLSYPLQNHTQILFVNEISQSKYEKITDFINF